MKILIVRERLLGFVLTAMLLGGGIVGLHKAGITELEAASREQLAEAAWQWPMGPADLMDSLATYQGLSTVQITSKWSPARLDDLIITFMDRDGQHIHSWKGHGYSVFVTEGNTLFYAEFSPIAQGCRIVAYDLKQARELWSVKLQAAPTSHSAYWNRVGLRLEKSRIVVYGNERDGRYVEGLNKRDGSQLFHKRFPPLADP